VHTQGGDHVVNLDDISADGQAAGRSARSYTHAISHSHSTMMHTSKKHHEAQQNTMKVFLGIILMAGLFATFGLVFYQYTSDGSKVTGDVWLNKDKAPVGVAVASQRVSLDTVFNELTTERRRHLQDGAAVPDAIHDSAQCVAMKKTADNLNRLFVTGKKGETFTCKVGTVAVDCNLGTTQFTCDTGEVLAYNADGERR